MKQFNQLNSLFWLLLLSITLACSREDTVVAEITEIPETAVEPDTFDFLALGDSYTIGQGVGVAERWPNQLSERLRENDIAIDSTLIIAQTGWTTRNLLNAVEATDLSTLRDDKMVSLLIGVNNQFQGIPFATFETEFELLLDRAIQEAGSVNKVFVVSIPDYGVTPFGSFASEQIAMELDLYNAYMEDRCEALNIPFINITEISRTLGSSEGALAPDNLHPSGFQYEQWVEEILPVVLTFFAG